MPCKLLEKADGEQDREITKECEEIIKTTDDVMEALCSKRLAEKVAEAKQEVEDSGRLDEWDEVSLHLVREAQCYGRWRVVARVGNRLGFIIVETKAWVKRLIPHTWRGDNVV